MLRPSPADLRRLCRADPVLGRAVRRVAPYPGFPRPGRARRETHYEALARAIVFQQLAGKAAATIHGRACALSGGRRFPDPECLLALPVRSLRGAGLSRPKQAALRDLASRVHDGRLRLHGIGRRTDAEIIEHLVTVRGIGVWSAQMFLIFRLGRLDVMPCGDLGVQEGLRRLDGLAERPGPKEVEARAARWAPLRTVAAWTLWRLTDTGAAP